MTPPVIPQESEEDKEFHRLFVKHLMGVVKIQMQTPDSVFVNRILGTKWNL
jgi:hypothetical protein